jgi:GTP cyclohydrolase FolE2
MFVHAQAIAGINPLLTFVITYDEFSDHDEIAPSESESAASEAEASFLDVSATSVTACPRSESLSRMGRIGGKNSAGRSLHPEVS